MNDETDLQMNGKITLYGILALTISFAAIVGVYMMSAKGIL